MYSDYGVLGTVLSENDAQSCLTLCHMSQTIQSMGFSRTEHWSG